MTRDLSSMDRACGFYPPDAGSIPAGRATSGALPPHRKVTAHGRMWTEEDMLAYAEQEVVAERERIAQMFDVPRHINGEAEDWSRAAAARIRSEAFEQVKERA